MGERSRAPLAALAASIGLIGVYVAFGGGTYEPAKTEDPCQTRDQSVLDERGIFEGIALSALDGAACELHVSREELTLALADEGATERFAEAHDIDSDAVDDAVRAGLERAVDDAAAAGRIDGVEEAILRQVARYAPVGPAISGLQALSDDDSVQGLIEELGEPHRRPDPRAREPAATPALNQQPPPATLRPRESQPPGDAAPERPRPTPPRGCVGRDRFGKDRRRPTLPGGFPPSTIGAEGLNGSVRNGKRCIPLAIATEIIRHRGGIPAAEASGTPRHPARLENCTQANEVKKKNVKTSTH